MMTKEELKQRRKAAYQEAKAKRDADPRYQAKKEQAKQQRHEIYQAHKNQQKNKKLDEKRARIAEKDAVLMSLLKPATELKNVVTSDDGKIVYVDFANKPDA